MSDALVHIMDTDFRLEPDYISQAFVSLELLTNQHSHLKTSEEQNS